MCGISIYSGMLQEHLLLLPLLISALLQDPDFFFFSSATRGFASGEACHLMALPAQPWCSNLQFREVVG